MSIWKYSLKMIEYLYSTLVGFVFMGLMILGRGKVRFDGERSLPKTPFILAANHVSYADWIILHFYFRMVFGRKINFLAKKRLFDHWYFRFLMHYGGAIYVDQERPSKNFFKMIKKSIANNNIVGIFPEGTRSTTGELLPGKPGIVKIIEFMKLPVVPVGLRGFEQMWGTRHKLPRIAPVTITIGAPLYFQELHNCQEEIMSTIMKRISELSGAPGPSQEKGIDH